jgi:phosphate transport system protein
VTISSYNSSSARTHFKRELQRLERDVLRMGALVETSFRLSHQALFDRDLSAAKTIPKLDKKIDRLYRKIESDCVLLMTLQAPVAQDCRLLGAFMQLVRDLERIGDYAKDLAEISLKIFPYPPHSCMPIVEKMSQQSQAMLAMSLAALIELDAEAGQQMKEKDSMVDASYETLYHTLAYQRNYTGVLEPILLLMLVIRYLERMADHATNIGQRVSYIVTGSRD